MAASQPSFRKSSDLLLRWIIGGAVGLAVFNVVMALVLGPGPVLVELPWYGLAIISFSALAALSIAFLAFGRYRVLREPAPFWIGMAFTTFAILAVFYVLTSPGLLPDGRSFIARLPNTLVWMVILIHSVRVVFLLAAAVVPWPRSGMPGEHLWFWLAIAISLLVAAIAGLSVMFEEILPIFVTDGVYTPLFVVWQFAFMTAFGISALLSAYRYRQTGNVLLGYVALTQVALSFYWLEFILSERRYDFWWYWTGLFSVLGSSAMLFGLLSDYVGLFRREQENARKLAALLQVTDPTLARQGLEPLLHSLLGRMVALMDANAAAILLLDPALQELVLKYDVGIPAQQAAGFHVGVGEGFAGRVAARNAVFWVRDAQSDPAVRSPYIRSSGVRGIMGAPMRIGEDVIGVVQVDFRIPKEFSRNEERLLEVVAERASLAIYQARLLEEAQRRAVELMELDRLKDQFLSVAAHELKTPVTGIRGYAQLLLLWEHEGISPRGRKALEAINRQTERISSLVNELLETSRIQTGRLQLHPTRFDLSQLAAEIVERMKIATEKHRLIFQSPGPVFVNADRERIEQVIGEQLDNAIKFSPQGGDIETTVRPSPGRTNGEAVVSVRDQGVGIPKDRQASIFERFYRAHTGTPYDYGGMGVGLFISREIITRHGGRMWFESEEGKGSTFYFTLPAA